MQIFPTVTKFFIAKLESQGKILNALEFKMRLLIATGHQGNLITFSFTTSTQQLSTNLDIRAVPNNAVFC